MARDLYKTVIVFEVLHEHIMPSDMDLPDIVRETISGGWSGSWEANTQRVTESEMADLLEAQGSDPAFLLGEDWDPTTYSNRTPNNETDDA